MVKESSDTDIPYNELLNSNTLNAAKNLVSCLEEGDYQRTEEIIRDLSNLREQSLFAHIGRLTRELHEALKNFGDDDCRFGEIAGEKLPTARARIMDVLERTENAANTTIDKIEETVPVSKSLAQESRDLYNEWGRFKRRELTIDEFRKLYQDMLSFLDSTQEKSKIIDGNLNDIVVAQSYQDLTGQILRKVISLVTDVETNLVALIRLSGNTEKVAEEENNASNDFVENQDEVDDILSSLGF